MIDTLPNMNTHSIESINNENQINLKTTSQKREIKKKTKLKFKKV